MTFMNSIFKNEEKSYLNKRLEYEKILRTFIKNEE